MAVLATAAIVLACGGGGGSQAPAVSSAEGGGTGAAGAEPAPASASGAGTAATEATPLVAQDGGRLVLRIDGPQAGIDHDELAVAGHVRLAGRLELQFGAAYAPSAGQTFTLIRAAQGLQGDFLAITNNKGLTVRPIRDATSFKVIVGN